MATINSSDYPTGASGKVLLGAGLGIQPTYSNASYPNLAGTLGNVLTSDGTNWLSSAPVTGGVTQVIQTMVTAAGAGTYTPTAGMVSVFIEAQGGGGGGGGAASTTASQIALGGGGGAGAYASAMYSAADIGASKDYVVGAAGAGGTAGANNGTAGGKTTFNRSWLQCNGGNGGLGMAATSTNSTAAGGTGGAVVIPTTGTGGLGSGGMAGDFGIGIVGTLIWNGKGAKSNFGAGGGYRTTTGNGLNGGLGGGGSGAFATVSAAAKAGGNGGGGFIRFTEFIA